MNYTIVKLDTRLIHDWDTFHEIFNDTFGFPDFYGRNMDAWIDCMTSLDKPEEGLTQIHAPADGGLVIQLEHPDDFRGRCPEQYTAIVECSAFVNWRRLEGNEAPVLFLSFWR